MGARSAGLLPLFGVLLAVPSGAAAAVTTTNVTTPADGTRIVIDNAASPPPVTVSGTAPGAATGDKVDLWCVAGTTSDRLVLHDAEIDGSDAFSVPVARTGFS